MALTKSNFGPQGPQRDSRADDAAKTVYQSGDATRMHRESGTAAVASEYTTGDGSTAAYADGAFTLGEATVTPSKAARNAGGATIKGYPANTD